MKIDSSNITEDIKQARPNVKENTIKQYEVNLKKLQKLYESDNYDFLSQNPMMLWIRLKIFII